MSKMVKNVKSKEMYLKLYYFLKKLSDTMYIYVLEKSAHVHVHVPVHVRVHVTKRLL